MKKEYHSKLGTVLSENEHEPDDTLLNLCPENNRGYTRQMYTKQTAVAPYKVDLHFCQTFTSNLKIP
jgi:hypothetical protein